MSIRTIDAPERGEYKGTPTLSIPTGEKGYAFTFGVKKARAIVAHIEAIRAFAQEHEEVEA